MVGEEQRKKEVRKEDFSRDNEAKEISEIAKKKLSEVLNKKAENTISISKEGESWKAQIEVVEEEYLPGQNLKSMSDIIAIYEVKISNTGKLLSWNKKTFRKRGDIDKSK